MAIEQKNFNWERIRSLLGIPYHDPSVQQLFSQLGLSPDVLWREVRVGIYSMPPFDQQPSPIAEIDLIPIYCVRIRFKHANLVVGANTNSPTTFVLAAVTYFLESKDVETRFRGELPYGILSTDKLESVVKRVGCSPTVRIWEKGEETGYVAWEDRNPILHVLFNIRENRILRVNVFLAPTPLSRSPPASDGEPSKLS